MKNKDFFRTKNIFREKIMKGIVKSYIMNGGAKTGYTIQVIEKNGFELEMIELKTEEKLSLSQKIVFDVEDNKGNLIISNFRKVLGQECFDGQAIVSIRKETPRHSRYPKEGMLEE